jgi:hypothetical protein
MTRAALSREELGITPERKSLFGFGNDPKEMMIDHKGV